MTFDEFQAELGAMFDDLAESVSDAAAVARREYATPEEGLLALATATGALSEAFESHHRGCAELLGRLRDAHLADHMFQAAEARGRIT